MDGSHAHTRKLLLLQSSFSFGIFPRRWQEFGLVITRTNVTTSTFIIYIAIKMAKTTYLIAEFMASIEKVAEFILQPSIQS